jgi:hypothetical protein
MSQSWKSSWTPWKYHLSFPVEPSSATVLSVYSRLPGFEVATASGWYMFPKPEVDGAVGADRGRVPRAAADDLLPTGSITDLNDHNVLPVFSSSA